ncbi:uncharacterized protein LOC131016403 [Salvia miltiorrhiza]|uniref:uncharacterized protein LOC131016403 n=1 Tax=Salvia miltiorrhiza TaxID=226208 RepID=UPI0025AB6B95|nr:uncharacterized protein LOC131016403 [Salvia miltiorrhiza]
MAYRRRQGGMSRSSTFKEEKKPPPDEGEWAATSSLAAQAIAASTAHRHSTGGPTYDYTAMGSSNETGTSFWGVLARKAKAILEDDNINSHPDLLHSHKRLDSPKAHNQIQHSKKLDTPIATPTSTPATLASSMRGKTLEEGVTGAEKKHETRKIQIVRKGSNQGHEVSGEHGKSTAVPPKNPTTQEDQLKASRDVAMATAAKAKLLLRELKTIKADLAFAKQRCSQLEEENKILRDVRDNKCGASPAHHDDDMIRNQLETLLAEKARLAHENSVYARENRVLREIVEYHQLTTQDVIYVDEGSDEVAEVHPIFYSASMPDSPTSPPEYAISLFRSASATAQLRFE